ncbi:ApeA N-terminal domain 1-containing protein [Halococcus hamelinensis]|uniref:ApeA N-terminal domain 1-containing protein n=3 Tax=Halococcus hamelinensis TaxID=332168 RepID=UPI000AFB2E12|nr:HEPN domain-containing protein [Halococcus hamelinensis]
MIEEREYWGYWWLPENPDEKVGGIASFSPSDGVSLELFSALNDDTRYMGSGTVYRPDFIHGITTDGEKITLKNCIRGNYSMSSSQGIGATSSTYQAIALLSGAHFTEQINFDRFRVQFPLLTKWSGVTGVSYSGSVLEGGEVSAGDTFEITYEFPESITADLDDVELKLIFNADFNMSQVGGASIDEDVYFDIVPDSGQMSYDTSFNYSRMLQDFITLATGKEVQSSMMIGRLERDERPGYDDVEILFSTSGDLKLPDSLHPLKANFVLADITEDFSEVMNNWFEHYKELEPVYNLYFSIQYNSEMYLQNQFLSLTQAIETYHRREIGGQYLSDDEFEEFYDELCENIPDRFDESFQDHLERGTFRYANEYSLRKRLSQLVSEQENIFEELHMDIAASVNEIVNTRNYLTHYDESISPRADTDELHPLILRLRAILEAVLLSNLGIPEDQITERLQQRYSELMRS